MSVEGWNETTWGEIVTLEYGKSLRDYANYDGTVPVFGTNGQIGFTDKALCPLPSVIVGRKGAYRGIHYSDRPFFVIDTAFYVKPKSSDLNLKFAYYQLLTQDINGMDSGSAIPSTSREDFYNLPIKLPPFPIQNRIASILSALDEKIELNRQTNTTLEAIAQAIFKEWFVDFNFPGATGEVVESELRMSPRGWQIKNLGDDPLLIIDGDRGTNYPKQEDFFDKEHCLFLSARNVTENGFTFTTCQFITKDKDEGLNKGKLNRRDIVLTTRGTVGNIAYYDDFIQFDNIRINSGMVIFRLINAFYPYFLYLFFKGDYFKDQIKSLITGSAQPQLPIRDIKKIKIVVPNSEVMNNFRTLLLPIEQRIALNHQENYNLITIRDALLPKLMSGEVEV